MPILSFKELEDDDSLDDELKLLEIDDLEHNDWVRECGVISLFKLATLPLMIPPSALMKRSCCSLI